MTRSILFAFTILGSVFLTACSNSDEKTPEVPQNIIDKSIAIFNGTVGEKKGGKTDGLDVWEVKIKNDAGAEITFHWIRSNETLLKMAGTIGPFDYNFTKPPVDGILNFTPAMKFAIAGAKNNDITSWLLQKEKDYNNEWVYTFEMTESGGNIEVLIDAATGDVLELN